MASSNLKNKIVIAGSMIIGLAAIIPFDSIASSQNDYAVEDRVVISPLFEYPVAPEELTDLQSKTDWLMDHFWEPMDFTSQTTVDQNALNDAFHVFGWASMYASKAKAFAAVNSLTKSLKGNPALLLQFAKGAEETFYGQRAEAWSDEMFIPFLEAVIAEKSIPETRKVQHKELLELLKKNAIGKKFPKLRLTLKDGRHKELTTDCDLTLVEIGNPDCDDCRFAKVKIEMAGDIQQMLADKELGMYFIVADAIPEEENFLLESFKSFPENWTTGISYGADEILDLRMTPTFYIIGKKGEIIAKNLDVDTAVENIRLLKASRQNKAGKKKK